MSDTENLLFEHLFGPVADERAEEAFEYVRDFMTDLPRPEAEV